MDQASALVELATAPGLGGSLPIILLGDLNVPPDAPEIRLIGESMTDAWTAVHGTTDSGVTLSSANVLASVDAWQIDRRIDYIFVRPGEPSASVRVGAAFMVGNHDVELPPSDHYAVVADIGVS